MGPVREPSHFERPTENGHHIALKKGFPLAASPMDPSASEVQLKTGSVASKELSEQKRRMSTTFSKDLCVLLRRVLPRILKVATLTAKITFDDPVLSGNELLLRVLDKCPPCVMLSVLHDSVLETRE
ncbi:hypothetical protein DFQ27_000929 [Actinomortierella ambigua]|uniref:Uncharacterized protein n=1 Tax=Actinomortierella ambigua TaxID=1343610 RepID=A0A9P6PLK7_9FUNG|nr:hypothetical protein DFQ27_000929 [Actinomortierella ambigua]